MAYKIYLSPSDQTANKYAYGSTNEAVQCRRIADALEKALKRCGFAVKNNKTDSMQARVRESNDWGADLHVPLHTNAYNGKVSGTRIFTYDNSGRGHKCAKKVFSFLAPVTPGASENISVDDELYEVECPNCHDIIYVDDKMLEDESMTCPNCGTDLEFDLEDEDADASDVE